MRDHVIVIPCDSVITVDSASHFFAFSAPAELHALHWHNGFGHIEYTYADQPNRILAGAEDYAVHVEPYVLLWTEEEERLREALRQAEAAATPATVEEAREQAVALLAERRWLAEQEHIVVDDVSFCTDRESRTQLMDAWMAVQENPELTVTWKTATWRSSNIPSFATLNARQVEKARSAVRAHVERCFELEAEKVVQIQKLQTVEAVQIWLDQKLEAGWPS